VTPTHVVALPEGATHDDLRLAGLIAVVFDLSLLYVAWTVEDGPTTAPSGPPPSP
jgi:hypothetical protein